jgi:putative spermidine/putrescine transport system permease protein
MTKTSFDLLNPRALKSALRLADRPNKLRALALALPAIMFLFITFGMPIGLFLLTSIRNVEVRETLPQTLAALADWDGRSVPPESAFAALAADLAVAKKKAPACVAV